MSENSKQPGTFRIASYNIRKCIGLDRRRDPKRTLKVIAGLDADIVALQEADKRLGQRPAAIPHALVSTHTDFDYAELSANKVSLGWHGNAVLLKKGTNVTSFERLDLPGLEPRGAVLVEIEREGVPLRIVSAHLGLVRRYRRQQLRRIMHLLEDLPPAPTLIAGDFNEWSRKKGTEPLDDGFIVLAPGLSFHARRPIAALDRIAVNDRLEVTASGVDLSALARTASDHLPVWADMRIKTGQ